MKTKKTLIILLAGLAFSGSALAKPPKAAKTVINPDALTETQRVQPVGPKTRGALVLRAQILLDRAHFSSGEIDGAYGANLRTAIRGYQKANDLSVSGTIDAASWTALNADTSPILAPYTIDDKDVAGPFEKIPVEMADKAKMQKLGYETPLEGLAEKFHISPKLLKLLNPEKDFSKAGVEIIAPNFSGSTPLPKAAKLIIDKTDSTLTAVDAAGKVIAQFPATMGSSRDPLPIGKWKVTAIARNPVFHYNPELFWDAAPKEVKAKIPAGPNNPVGVVWIDLSKEHYGIHGTPEPSQIGKTQSHGCIRLTNWDADALARAVGAGVEVVMQE